ncbi:MAG: hypothetical protein IT314_10095 [Anaerolineales bacterium]|nr:hypothetical protein [Anaerolineales bacterium]
MIQNSRRWHGSVREITETLIAIPSVSPDAEGENRCAEEIAELLAGN